jgi:AhpD family alkylhydroperoxidase
VSAARPPSAEPRDPGLAAPLACRRAASGERSVIAAISSKGTANMSCRTKATRSAGASVSSTSSASPTESAISASYSGSVPSTGLPATTAMLVHLRASRINGCSVCAEMHARELKEAGEPARGGARWRAPPRR